MASNQILLHIRKRSGLVFQGYVRSITSKNDNGVFDVLPGHANFITLIEENIHVISDTGEVRDFEIERALMKVDETKAEIFLDITSFDSNEG